jgi:hypothetical protein
MDTGLLVDKQEGLKEFRGNDLPSQHAAVRIAAKIISYIFHPVFVPVYIVLYMVYVHPYLFPGVSDWEKSLTVIRAILMYTFFPVVAVLLLKALDFIKSFYLKSQKDRIIPLVLSGIWYFWIWYVWRNLPEYPHEAVQFTLAIWISVSLALMVNIVMKVSLHAISMGVMLAFIFHLAFSQQLNFGIYISASLLIAGLVCTSRFIVSDHNTKEVYAGLVTGIVSMLAAIMFG